MLPNFRRAESGSLKSQPSLSNIEPPATPPAFPPRPYLAVAARTKPSRSVSVIGSDLIIAGNLTCKGEVQVDGIVEGDIQGSNVVVGESATITGSIAADEVIVRGHVVGSVYSRRVMLQTTSQVEGDIYHQSLSIEQGAMFEGKSRRSNDDPRTLLKNSEPENIVLPLRPPELTELTN